MANEIRQRILEDKILRSPNSGLNSFVEGLQIRCTIFKWASIFGTIFTMSPIILFAFYDLSDPLIRDIDFGDLFVSKLKNLVEIACVTIPIIALFKMWIIVYERNLNKLRRTLNIPWTHMLNYMHSGKLLETAIELSRNHPQKIQDEVLRLLKKLRIGDGLHGKDRQTQEQHDEFRLC